MKELTTCRVCSSHNLTSYLNLGKVPLANRLIKHIDDYVETFPLEVLFCQDCSLSQLRQVVDPSILFSNYPYHSSVSQTFKDHCYDMAIKLKEFEFSKPTGNLPLEIQAELDKKTSGWRSVLDIACNDTCLLKEFRRSGKYIVQGVDPANNMNTLKEQAEGLIPVIQDYWREDTFDRFTRSPYEFIIAQNVLGHVDDLGDFLRGVYKWLKDDGVFVVEVPYLNNLLNNNQFDTIYHEHLSYFLLKPLTRLFNDNRLPIFNVEQYPIHGGSIRIYASKGAHEINENVQRMLDFEESRGLYSIEIYNKFAKRAFRVMNEFRICLENIYEGGKKVMAYGASAKGISLMNYSGISRKHIHAIVDDTPDKQWKLCPGTLIPIISSSSFKEDRPDYIILLAWNFQKELMAKCWWHNGKYIIPIPEVEII